MSFHPELDENHGQACTFDRNLTPRIGITTLKPIPLVRQVTIAPAVSYLAAEGVPVRRYLRRASLSFPSPGTLETLVPLHQACDFLSSVARAKGIHDLGFRVTGQQGMEHLGVYVSPTFRFRYPATTYVPTGSPYLHYLSSGGRQDRPQNRAGMAG